MFGYGGWHAAAADAGRHGIVEIVGFFRESLTM